MHMAEFRNATFFTTLAINASTVLSLSIYSILFFLLIMSRFLAPKTVISRNAQYISTTLNVD